MSRGGATIRLSAVMTVFNGATYLREALDSVLSELGGDDEFIVVDDGSTDETANILSGYGHRLRVIRQENGGIGAGLNTGIAAARGALLAFNDADDLWVADALSKLVAELEAAPETDGVFGMSEQFVSPELAPHLQVTFEPPARLLPGQIIPCLVIRRTSFMRTGGFDASLRFTPFAEWLPRGRGAGLSLKMSNVLFHRRRLHPSNLGRMKPTERDAELRQVLFRHLKARKGSQSAG